MCLSLHHHPRIASIACLLYERDGLASALCAAAFRFASARARHATGIVRATHAKLFASRERHAKMTQAPEMIRRYTCTDATAEIKKLLY